jgi:hypothetical protein
MKRFLLDYTKRPSSLPKQTFKSALCGQRDRGKGMKNGQRLALMLDYDHKNSARW